MENQIWERVALFLKELRCEDIRRNSIIHLESCRNEKKCLEALKKKYNREMSLVSEAQHQIIAEYIEQLQVVSFEEQQEAYCQGIMDCVQILVGLGLLEMNGKIIQAVEKLK